MKIRFDFEIHDLVAFAQNHARRSPGTRPARIIVFLIVVTLLVALPAAFFRLESLLIAFVPCLAIAVVLAVRLPTILRQSVDKQIRKAYNDPRYRDNFGEWELELTPDRIVKRTRAGESSTRYSAIGPMKQTPDYTFIYVSPTAAFIIPRHAVNAGDYDQFAEAVAVRLGEVH